MYKITSGAAITKCRRGLYNLSSPYASGITLKLPLVLAIWRIQYMLA